MAKKKSADEELLQRIKDRQQMAADAGQDQRKQSLADLNFCDVEKQWPDDIKAQRDSEGRPCIVVDRLTPFVNQLTNEQRQNRQSIKVAPVDDGGDEETAEVIQGLIRHIEYSSNADVAYDRACLAQIRMGFGYFRVYSDYCDPESFDQDIKIGSIANPFMVYFDPSSILPDGSDAEWAMIAEDMSAAEYKKTYPDSQLANATPVTWESIGDEAPEWIVKDENTCRVVEYFEKTRKPIKLVRLDTGKVVKCTDGSAKIGEPYDEGIAQDIRDSFITITRWIKANAIEILESSEWPGKWIPIIPVYGQELIVNGKVMYSGIIRQMADIQRMHNYWKSAQTEAIALAPKAPWIASQAAIAGYEDTWKSSNRRNLAVLPYNDKDESGNPIEKPYRDVQEPAIQAITMAIAGTEEDFKATTGMYDPSLGNRGSADQSGRAIAQLQRQGQVGNFHFQDNLSRSLRHLGRIILDLLPHYYDGARVIRIIGADEASQTVKINQPTGEKDPKTGIDKVFDLTTGTYDVVVSAGPSYATKRQENLDIMLKLLHEVPQLGQIAADLIVSQMDTPIAKELSERFKMALPPQFHARDGQEPIPPQIQAHMQQMQQQEQQYEAALHDAMKQIEDLKSERDIKTKDMQTKLEIAAINAETSITVAEINGKSKVELAAFQGHLDRMQAGLDALVAQTQLGMSQNHEADLQASDQEHQMAMASMPSPEPNEESGPTAGGEPNA